MAELKINDEGKMIRGLACQVRMDDPHVVDFDQASGEHLVEREEWPACRERAEPSPRDGDLVKLVVGERAMRQGVPPVVKIPGYQCREGVGFSKERMLQEMSDLPVPLLLGQAKVPVDDVERPLGRLDDGELGAPWLAFPQSERNLMHPGERPS